MKRILLGVLCLAYAAGCATQAQLAGIAAKARIPQECRFIGTTPQVADLGTKKNLEQIVAAMGGGNVIIVTGRHLNQGLLALANTWWGELYDCDSPNQYQGTDIRVLSATSAHPVDPRVKGASLSVRVTSNPEAIRGCQFLANVNDLTAGEVINGVYPVRQALLRHNTVSAGGDTTLLTSDPHTGEAYRCSAQPVAAQPQISAPVAVEIPASRESPTVSTTSGAALKKPQLVRGEADASRVLVTDNRPSLQGICKSIGPTTQEYDLSQPDMPNQLRREAARRGGNVVWMPGAGQPYRGEIFSCQPASDASEVALERPVPREERPPVVAEAPVRQVESQPSVTPEPSAPAKSTQQPVKSKEGSEIQPTSPPAEAKPGTTPMKTEAAQSDVPASPRKEARPPSQSRAAESQQPTRSIQRSVRPDSKPIYPIQTVRDVKDAWKVLVTNDVHAVLGCTSLKTTDKEYDFTGSFPVRDVQEDAARVGGNVVLRPTTVGRQSGVIFSCPPTK